MNFKYRLFITFENYVQAANKNGTYFQPFEPIVGVENFQPLQPHKPHKRL
jgi:hypothetical protein